MFLLKTIMISLLGKATLYDMLACVIPGYLLLLLLKLCFASSTAIKFDNISVAIAAFTLSYLVGLLIKRGMEVVFNGFLRNSSDRIRRAYNKSKCIFRKKHLPDNENDLLELYYTAYNKALRGNPNTSIPIFEAQIAFLRSILPIMFLYLVTSYCWLGEIGCKYGPFIFIAIVILVGCSALIWHLQAKLHQLVWEDEYYSDLANNDVSKAKT